MILVIHYQRFLVWIFQKGDHLNPEIQVTSSDHPLPSPSFSTQSQPASNAHLIPTPDVRCNRPQRTKQLPAKLKDYTGIPSHLCNLTYDTFTEPYQHFLVNVDHIQEPQTYKQTCKSSK